MGVEIGAARAGVVEAALRVAVVVVQEAGVVEAPLEVEEEAEAEAKAGV